MKNNKSIIQIGRTIIQILAFVLYTGLWILTFEGLKQLYLYFTTGTPRGAELFSYIIPIIAIIPVSVLFGRFFCGWLCAFGSFGEFLYSATSKLFKKKKITPQVDGILKYFKYVVLAFIVFVFWSGMVSTASILSPWDSFGRMFSFVVGQNGFTFNFALPAITIGLVLLAGIIAGSIYVERFFCRYMCPLGAFFAVTSKLRILKIKKPTQHCGSCRVCTNNCPMGIELYKKEKITSGDCISCLKCTTVCPRQNTKLAVYATDLTPAVAAGIALSTMFGSYALANQVDSHLNKIASHSVQTKTANAQKAVATVSTNKYKNGTFTGVGQGYQSNVQVSVTVANDRITNVVVDSINDVPQ